MQPGQAHHQRQYRNERQPKNEETENSLAVNGHAASVPVVGESLWTLGKPTLCSPSPLASLFIVMGGTLSGFRFNGPPTQGSSFLATLGWRTQSLWDWEGAKHTPSKGGEGILTTAL